ncbi:3-ketodihydrosphingosine reductase [Planococcus citri]|uniref:3-ketodihydrosphingosine reductase n=1 Tax=Planococcus citri TaxID=170843 RepID=UPI0031F78C60
MDFFFYFWLCSYIFCTVALLHLFVLLLKKLLKTPSDINGKHVLITGGSSGIGKGVAIEVAKLGANVTIVARDAVKLQSAVDEIQKACVKQSQKVNYISLDISTNYENVEKVLNEAEQNLGPVYMLVNCAGTCICGKFEDMSVDDVHYLVNLNYMGTVHTIKSLIGKMKTRKEGYVVITASQAALIGIFGLSIYSSTKFALRGLAETLYMELKHHGIHVTLALPPDTDTPGFANEEKSKPLETKIISESGGLYAPEKVAARIVKDTLEKSFFSTIGLESYLVTVLCSGMSPVRSFLDIIHQAPLLGLLRVVSYFIQAHFLSIIKKCAREEESKKKIS